MHPGAIRTGRQYTRYLYDNRAHLVNPWSRLVCNSDDSVALNRRRFAAVRAHMPQPAPIWDVQIPVPQERPGSSIDNSIDRLRSIYGNV